MEWVEWWISNVVHHEDRIISPKQHKKKNHNDQTNKKGIHSVVYPSLFSFLLYV